MSTQETQATLNIPSLLAFTALTILAIRYFFFSPSSTTTTTTTTTTSSSTPPTSQQQRSSRARIPPDRIDTVASMFPQLSRRDIEWDLRRNGASVQATTERVLRDGRLPGAPADFRAQTPPAAAVGTQGQRQEQKMPAHENLIQRYRLGGKVRATGDVSAGNDEEDEALQTGEKQRAKGGWSSSKNERAEMLKRRREEMVLAARRKMETKERKEGKAKVV